MNEGWGSVSSDPWLVAPVDLFAAHGLSCVVMAGAATFDYVIVGAGSAGCVMANRLSEDHSVLVLEAGGPDEASEISVPAAFSELFKTDVDWAYHTEPQPELDDRELYWPRGKVLGGSSSINAQIHVRGHPADYDEWAARGTTAGAGTRSNRRSEPSRPTTTATPRTTVGTGGCASNGRPSTS